MIDNLEEFLAQSFPNVNLEFVALTIDELELYLEKNADYTKGGDPKGNFLRVASILRNYPGLDLGNLRVVAIVYMMKQLDAALWMLSQGYEGQVENIDTRLRDVHIYAKIARTLKGKEGEAPIRKSMES